MPVNKVRRNGSYAPLSAHYYKDDAVIAAGEKAEVLYTRSLAFCADVLNDGFISDRQLAHVGVGLGTLKARAAALVREGLWIRDDQRGGWTVRSWLKWNRSADEISQLMTKDTERKRPGGRHNSRPDSERKPDGNRPVSEPASGPLPNGFQPHARDSTPHTDTEPHTDTGREAPASPPAPPPAPTKRGTRLPDNFAVDNDMKAWFTANCPGVDGKRETEKFRNYWTAKSGKDATKLDWPATWRNWMLRAAENGKSTPSSRATGANRHLNGRDDNPFRNGQATATYASRTPGAAP
ncbi:hypothetical protein [Salinispora tropica]|uniref:Uncharacterized protein n=1 Tax=Salinispora tropica (strain ATCC BAA-916 / DSM 44818 / JCM 13857 / NBRC 105044 / CNB-440) TaxID=369723 RepID=A4XBX9_SALTO|nr:hypothetical protein [Salinispora tropica]ABP56436.1 hypothetical protein Strop_4006 [Salinispora tropica CNB-440]